MQTWGPSRSATPPALDVPTSQGVNGSGGAGGTGTGGVDTGVNAGMGKTGTTGADTSMAGTGGGGGGGINTDEKEREGQEEQEQEPERDIREEFNTSYLSAQEQAKYGQQGKAVEALGNTYGTDGFNDARERFMSAYQSRNNPQRLRQRQALERRLLKTSDPRNPGFQAAMDNFDRQTMAGYAHATSQANEVARANMDSLSNRTIGAIGATQVTDLGNTYGMHSFDFVKDDYMNDYMANNQPVRDRQRQALKRRLLKTSDPRNPGFQAAMDNFDRQTMAGYAHATSQANEVARANMDSLSNRTIGAIGATQVTDPLSKKSKRRRGRHGAI